MVVDFLGKEIKPGQTIVYPGRKSSSLWMNKAVVREVFPGYQRNEFDHEPPLVVVDREPRWGRGKIQRVQLTNVQNVIIVETAQMQEASI